MSRSTRRRKAAAPKASTSADNKPKLARIIERAPRPEPDNPPPPKPKGAGNDTSHLGPFRTAWRESAPSVPAAEDFPRIVSRTRRVDPQWKLLRQRVLERLHEEEDRDLSGTYRVIHGRVAVPLPPEAWTSADGKRIPGAPKQQFALAGDVVELGDEDAARMLDADIIEPLDARPSRVGQVFSPPKPLVNDYVRYRGGAR